VKGGGDLCACRPTVGGEQLEKANEGR
jgi:hypothetical protein